MDTPGLIHLSNNQMQAYMGDGPGGSKTSTSAKRTIVPLYAELIRNEERLQSFSLRPKDPRVKVEKLAEAGFFSTSKLFVCCRFSSNSCIFLLQIMLITCNATIVQGHSDNGKMRMIRRPSMHTISPTVYSYT